MKSPQILRRSWLSVALLAFAASAIADDEGPSLSVSGFGTIGAARSDQPWRYQRYLHDRVSFERDTVFGLQADVEFNHQWSATVQGKLAPSVERDSKWSLGSEWAFIAWRPSNDWLLRAGKFRAPFFLRSEVLDVGQAYDEARLPSEVYGITPTNNFQGLHISRSLALGDDELNIEFYSGTAKSVKRQWVREAIPSPVPGGPALVEAGAMFRHVRIAPTGLLVTWRSPKSMLRAGLHHATVRLGESDGASAIVKPVWAQLAPGVGYWQTTNLLPGPGVADGNRFTEWALTVAGEWQGPQGWRAGLDLARMKSKHSEMVHDGWFGAVTVYKATGAFVPYASLAIARSTGANADWARTLDTTTVPAAVPGADLLNASMRTAADLTQVQNQRSLALGSSYALTPTSKLKLEWMHSRILMSDLVDLPAGEPLYKRRKVNVLSASYSFVF